MGLKIATLRYINISLFITMKFATLHFKDFFSFIRIWFNKTYNTFLSTANLDFDSFQNFLTSLLFVKIRIFADIDRSQRCKLQAHVYFLILVIKRDTKKGLKLLSTIKVTVIK